MISTTRPLELISTPTIVRDRENGWIYAHWVGMQSMEMVETAGLHHLAMLAEEPCPRLLNNHQDVIGRFMSVNEWIVDFWAPRAQEAGLRTVAQVLAPNTELSPAVRDLVQRLTPRFSCGFFTDLPTAREWLAKQP